MTAPLIHLVRKPESPSGPPPMLILLHGFGSNEEDLFSLEGALDPGWIVVSARAPQTLGPGSYAWFPLEFTPQGPVSDPGASDVSRGLIAQFVTWAIQAFGADPRRVVLGGFSQGAIMTAAVTLTAPEKLVGALLMSGRIQPEILPLVAPLELRLKPRYLVLHGTHDPVLPIHHGRESRSTLRSLGIEPEYHEFAMGHTISDESLGVALEWLRPWNTP